MSKGWAFLACVAVLFPALALAQDARAFERAYRQRDWTRAARVAERWASREPENPAAAYNAACAYARAGQAETALSWLRLAGDAGFAGERSVDEDPDLESLRALDGFEEAVAVIRANRSALFEDFKRDAEQSEILVIRPEGFDGPRPLILVLHGYGGKPAANAEMYREAAAELGAIIAAPAAIRPGPRGRGYSWKFRDESEWWVLRAIEKVSARFDIDPDRVVLAGFSQGANVALAVGLEHSERFAGVVAVAGHYEPHLMRVRGGSGPRVYLLTGQRDPAASTFRAAEANLLDAGLSVELRVIPELGHAFPPRPASEVARALEFVLSD